MAAKTAGRKAAPKKTAADDKKYLCPFCMKEKKKSEFYTSSDPLVLTGITAICKDCTRKIALGWDEHRSDFGACTKKTVMEALERIDKPFLEAVWNSAYNEWASQSDSVRRPTIWDSYIRTIVMVQYRGLRWRDGDIFQTYIEDAKQVAALEMGNTEMAQTLIDSQEVDNEFMKNRKDVIRLLGYDPFDGEKLEDQPLLYSQLIGYLDAGGDGNDDMMRTSSAITIVRGFLQQAKLDDKLAKVMANSNANAAEMKTLLDAKKNISATISQLAEQSCLSLRYNKNASKGENTWTGKIKKIKELNLREGEVNGFDLMTCKGMQQVMDLSNASILKQLALDESEYSNIIAEQRKMVTELTTERDSYKEITRILLRENLDLKDVLDANGLLDVENLTDLENLFSVFGDIVYEEDDDKTEDGGDTDE